MIGARDGLDQSGERAAEIKEIDAVVPQRRLIVGRHRLGLAADQRDPLRVGFTRERADGESVPRDRLSQLQGLDDGSGAQLCATWSALGATSAQSRCFLWRVWQARSASFSLKPPMRAR